MIERDDLKAAVGSGLISEAQAASLAALADSRRGARSSLAIGDEPFELFRGFNEIFIVVGLGILAAGWFGVAAVTTTSFFASPITHTVAVAVVGAVLLWCLAEYFVRRRRMVAPSIALSLMFGGNAMIGFTALLSQPFMVAQNDFSSLPLPVAFATLAMLVFWLRFRVPFAMAMIAVGLFAATILIAAEQSGTPANFTDLFLLSAGGPFAWITLVLGLAVFAVAMSFDMSDPHRVTRRSAQGFWLHVVAAPALVNTVGLSLLSRETAGSDLVLLAFLALFAVVAVIIDRRSFLIAAIGYLVTLATTVLPGETAAFTVLALGLVLLLLGAFWEKLRARLLRSMSFLPLHRLPPIHTPESI